MAFFKKRMTLRQVRKYLREIMIEETNIRLSEEPNSQFPLQKNAREKKLDDANWILKHFKRIPDKLYKYRECNKNNFDVLEKSEIYLSSADNFVDPFDCRLPFSIKDLPDQQIKILAKWFVFSEYIYGYEKENLVRFENAFTPEEARRIMFSKCYSDEIIINGKETVKYIKKNYPKEQHDNIAGAFVCFDRCITQHGRGCSLYEWFKEDCEKGCEETVLNRRKSEFVCSLTETNNNPKMWEEYADNYSGYCIEFDFSRGIRADLLEDAGEVAALKSILPVFYMDKKPNFDSYKYQLRQYQDTFYENKDDYWEPELSAELKLYSLMKNSHYASEQEWRVTVYGESSGPLWFPFVSAIYLGKDISQENKTRLLEIAGKINASVYQQIVMPNGFTYECVKSLKPRDIKWSGTIHISNRDI